MNGMEKKKIFIYIYKPNLRKVTLGICFIPSFQVFYPYFSGGWGWPWVVELVDFKAVVCFPI